MKALKIILFIVIGLVVIVAVLSFVAPVKMHAERSIFIKAPKEAIFTNVKMFSNYPKWSPWLEKDSNAKTAIAGMDGTVGAKYSWEGNSDVGKGEQTISKMEVNKSIETDLHFIKPWEGKATSYIHLEDSADGTKVIWGFNSEMSRPFNIMGLFMSMDKAIGDEYDKGLGKLKMVSEKEGTNMSNQINEITLEPKTYIGIKKTMSSDKITSFFAENYPKLFSVLHQPGIAPAGPPTGLYYSFDEKTLITDVAAAAPVTGVKGKIDSWETFNLKGGKALEMDFYGDYKNLGIGHNKLKEYAAAKNMKITMPIVEEYITDPMSEKDPAKWLTKIYYFVE
jgi:effector-binding domain-containing protein